MKQGDRYRHYKGRFYTIVVPDAMCESTEERVVVYKGEESGEVYVRPITEFNANVEGDSVPVGTKRFTKVD